MGLTVGYVKYNMSTRPVDWAYVLAIKDEVEREMAKANHNTTPQHSTRDVFDWQSPKVAVLIEGWVEREDGSP